MQNWQVTKQGRYWAAWMKYRIIHGDKHWDLVPDPFPIRLDESRIATRRCPAFSIGGHPRNQGAVRRTPLQTILTIVTD